MDLTKNQVNFKSNSSVSFADEIIIGEDSIISRNFNNNSTIDLFPEPTTTTLEKQEETQNYLLNFSILSFFLIALLLLVSKIITTTFITFSDITTTFFVSGYFLIFILTIYFLLRSKTLTLRVKDETLHIKSFPSLNRQIPINQILKCEVNSIETGKLSNNNKMHFALNEDGNKYKQPLKSGVTLQLLNGKHIIIGSHKE